MGSNPTAYWAFFIFFFISLFRRVSLIRSLKEVHLCLWCACFHGNTDLAMLPKQTLGKKPVVFKLKPLIFSSRIQSLIGLSSIALTFSCPLGALTTLDWQHLWHRSDNINGGGRKTNTPENKKHSCLLRDTILTIVKPWLSGLAGSNIVKVLSVGL